MDSPTSSVLSPIEKRRLCVEESSEIVIAETEKKVCHPEDLIVKNGFKSSGFHTDQPCLPNCKDPDCVFGYTCKCPSHREMNAVLVGQCFSVFKNSGYCTITWLYRSALDRIQKQKKAEVSKVDSFTSFEER